MYIWAKAYPINIIKIISSFYYIFAAIPIISFLLLQKSITDKRLWVIVVLLIFGFGIDAYSIYLAELNEPNFLFFNWFVLIESSLLYIFFYTLYIKRVTKRVVIFFTAFFLFLWTSFYIKNGTIGYLDATVTFENISIIALSIFYFFEQMNKSDSLMVYNQPSFWVVVAYFIYSAGTFFLFIYINSFPKDVQQKYYILNDLLSIVKYLLLTVAMFRRGGPKAKQKFQLT